jgi:hypothetical protein
MRVGLARLAVEPSQPLVAVGAGALAIVAADAQILVDEEDVGRLADPFSTRKLATDEYMSTTPLKLSFLASTKSLSWWRAAISRFARASSSASVPASGQKPRRRGGSLRT